MCKVTECIHYISASGLSEDFTCVPQHSHQFVEDIFWWDLISLIVSPFMATVDFYSPSPDSISFPLPRVHQRPLARAHTHIYISDSFLRPARLFANRHHFPLQYLAAGLLSVTPSLHTNLTWSVSTQGTLTFSVCRSPSHTSPSNKPTSTRCGWP
jgi:hypothetical protein